MQYKQQYKWNAYIKLCIKMYIVIIIKVSKNVLSKHLIYHSFLYEIMNWFFFLSNVLKPFAFLLSTIKYDVTLHYSFIILFFLKRFWKKYKIDVLKEMHEICIQKYASVIHIIKTYRMLWNVAFYGIVNKKFH